MNDRDLLEAAARAAGYTLELHHDVNGTYWPWCMELAEHWCPLTNDGDEARMEAVLQLHVTWHPAQETVTVGTDTITDSQPYGNDRQAARRRAGVRVAAELGKVHNAEVNRNER